MHRGQNYLFDYLSKYFNIIQVKIIKNQTNQISIYSQQSPGYLPENPKELDRKESKQARPRSDCSQRSSLILVHPVCRSTNLIFPQIA